MDNQRIFLYGALGLILFVVWQTWQVDYGDAPGESRSTGEQVETRSGDGEQADTDSPDDIPDAPEADASEADGGDAASGDSDPAASEDVPGGRPALPSGERIHVETDLLDIVIDTKGGDIREARLREHHQTADGDEPVQLLTDDAERLYVVQAGLRARGRDAPTHHATWETDEQDYRLGDEGDSVEVPLHWEGDGTRVTKTYTFQRDDYAVDVSYEIENTSDEAWTGFHYHQIQRAPREGDETSFLIRTYTGGAYYSPEDHYTRLAFDDIADDGLDREIENGWTSMVNHYFISAWIPPRDEAFNYYARTLEGDGTPRYIMGLHSPTQRVAAGESVTLDSRLYLGPKEQARLSAVAEGLDLSVDYGYMTLLSRPLFWVLDKIHDLVGNWGWSIVLLTFLIKLVFYKLSEKSFKSMAHMRRAQPKIQQIKDRYGDDREKMGRAMMDLYKTEKINPLGGCLPILVQIPVFIALFWMLLGSIELRHAPFMLWIQDLSARDPYFVLPLLMGASMWLQQRLNPAPVDPIQQKIFMALPFVFTVFFAFFPAGLVLYWLTNNVLSISQQYYITRYVVGEYNKDKAAGTTSKNRRVDGASDDGESDEPQALEHDAEPAAAVDDTEDAAEQEAEPGDARDVRDKKKGGKRKGQRRK